MKPVERVDGYLPIAEYGLIGDGTMAALVGRDGAIDWLCVPRFDAPPLFGGILDARCGGTFQIAPEGMTAARESYEPDTGILITDLRTPTGGVRLTDALTLHSGADLGEEASAGRGELPRSLHVLRGSVRLALDLAPRGGAAIERRGGGWCLRWPARPDLDLQLSATRDLTGPGRGGTSGQASASIRSSNGGPSRPAIIPSRPTSSCAARRTPGDAGCAPSPTRAHKPPSSAGRRSPSSSWTTRPTARWSPPRPRRCRRRSGTRAIGCGTAKA